MPVGSLNFWVWRRLGGVWRGVEGIFRPGIISGQGEKVIVIFKAGFENLTSHLYHSRRTKNPCGQNTHCCMALLPGQMVG